MINRLIPAQLACADAVSRAVQGNDAILVTLGLSGNPLRVRLRRRDWPALRIRSSGTQNVVTAMQALGVRRSDRDRQPCPRQRCRCSLRSAFELLANAKLAENDAQQIIGAEVTGDLAQLVLRKPQFLGQQF